MAKNKQNKQNKQSEKANKKSENNKMPSSEKQQYKENSNFWFFIWYLTKKTLCGIITERNQGSFKYQKSLLHIGELWN